jgi:hypothetical protein
MQANVGDTVLVPGRKVGTAERRGRITEVRGPHGQPPYLVRWDSAEQDCLFFPSAGVIVAKAERKPRPRRK